MHNILRNKCDVAFFYSLFFVPYSLFNRSVDHIYDFFLPGVFGKPGPMNPIPDTPCLFPRQSKSPFTVAHFTHKTSITCPWPSRLLPVYVPDFVRIVRAAARRALLDAIQLCRDQRAALGQCLDFLQQRTFVVFAKSSLLSAL